MELTIYSIESKPIVAAKAIREALRKLHGANCLGLPKPTFADAQAVLNEVRTAGSALLGEVGEQVFVDDLIDALRVNGVFVSTDGVPEDAELGPPVQDDDFQASPATRTALVLMMSAEGNPLNAAANARTLFLAQGGEVWVEAQKSIIQAFPWILEPLTTAEAVL